MIKPKWIRLMKHDRHLGGLYDPQRGIIRFVSRDGTVDYDLVALAQDEVQTQIELPTKTA
jgi:hypothetical protein